MGKNKIGKQPVVKDPPKSTAAPAAPAAPEDTPEAVGTDYLSRLPEEERLEELQRREAREKKAQAAKKKEEEDRYWREQRDQKWKAENLKAQRIAKKEDREMQALVAQARKEGVLEAQEYPDGYWYVQISADMWKQMDYAYYCVPCEASLTEATLGAHLYGQKHQKRLDAAAWEAGAGAGVNVCPPCTQRSTVPLPSAGALEVWQEMDQSGYKRCLACNKICDGVHEHTTEHRKRVDSYLWHMQASTNIYSAPEQPWLAWVPEPSFGNGRYLKCLMCQKWVDDLDQRTTAGYCGSHGNRGECNQKDHAKKLNNLQYYIEDLAIEKELWHPTQAAQPTHAPGSLAAALAAAPAAPGAEPPLPDGWKEVWDPSSQRYYYYNSSGSTTWERPVAPSVTVFPAPPPPPEQLGMQAPTCVTRAPRW